MQEIKHLIVEDNLDFELKEHKTKNLGMLWNIRLVVGELEGFS